MAAYFYPLSQLVLRRTACQRNHCLATPKLLQIMCMLYRTKTHRYNLQSIIRLNQENFKLFGPKLKPKSKKSKKDNRRKSNLSKAKGILSAELENCDYRKSFVEFENEIVSDQSDWYPYVSDGERVKSSNRYWNTSEEFTIDLERLTDRDISSKPKKSNDSRNSFKNSKSECSRSSKNSQNLLKSNELENDSRNSFNRPTGESKENLPRIQILDTLANVSLNPDRSEVENHLQPFKSYVDKFSLRKLPSVGAILNKTQSETSKFYLERWKQQMIKELGEDGFKKFQEEQMNTGTNLHANIQQFLAGERDIQVQPNVEGYWQSLNGILSKLGDVLACELSISHDLLMYKGTFDCVAVYRDNLCLIDWKTSRKPKPLLTNTFDSPIQVAAYVGAVNCSSQMTFSPVKNAAVVIAYPWGEPAHVHLMEPKICQQYWSKWLERLQQYWRIMAAEKNIV